MPTHSPRPLSRNVATGSTKLAAAAEATRKPTLDELREKHELGTLERVKIEAVEHGKLEIVSKEASNAVNRQKTQLRNSIKEVIRIEELTSDDEVLVGDTAYRMAVTESEAIDVAKFFEMFESKKITREQFLQCIDVKKGDAQRIIGDHKLQGITAKTHGKKADIRTSELKNPVDVPTIKRKTESTGNDTDTPPWEEPVIVPSSPAAVPKRAGGLRIKRRITT